MKGARRRLIGCKVPVELSGTALGGPSAAATEPPPEWTRQTSAEQQARDMLERAGVENAQDLSASSLVEIANLIAGVVPKETRMDIDQIRERKASVERKLTMLIAREVELFVADVGVQVESIYVNMVAEQRIQDQRPTYHVSRVALDLDL
jgi:hypothetical protein